MKKILKIALWSLLGLVLLAGGALGLFIYKVKYGFPVSYETDTPSIEFPTDKPAVLLFSKTTGFRHEASIAASKPIFQQLAEQNGWFLYETEEGGVFNEAQLAKFNTVIFNNSTGEVLNDDQKRALEQYVEKGGGLIGIHGAGDDSHHWEWYQRHLTGVLFSHHPIKQQFQKATVLLDIPPDSLFNTLTKKWEHTDEWYVFFENPRSKGFNIVYTIDGEAINPDGNILFVKSKNFGMGKDHPVAWYKPTGLGKTFYTSIGHDDTAWQNENFLKLIESAIRWTQSH
ncbi:MAG: ThuA domain-containing protein [Runella sp.]